jgi:hypothetical protein
MAWPTEVNRRDAQARPPPRPREGGSATYWLQMKNKGPIVAVQWNNKAVAEVFGMRANRASNP